MRTGCLGLLASLAILALAADALAWWQARRPLPAPPTYVAMGSSFAAGAGLGSLAPGSPWLCARSTAGYPPQLARMLKLPLTDMSCGGAVTHHLLHGGQFFQGPQLRAVGPATRLVTITVGGNDVGYIGDLSLLAARHSHSLWGWLVRSFWPGPEPVEARDWTTLERELAATITAVHRQAPAGRVVVATYPAILPPRGTCPALALTANEAALMRTVGDRLAATTRAAATKAGATVIDMTALGQAHNACATQPWARGYAGIAPFHPTLVGAHATATAIAITLRSPARKR
ncbi:MULTISPECIES: SGNH/GDSL hydrolase family protein [Sphingomonas]|uniref:SGNH/GDSL hydrolase family protein n=1 Tax=Sphingomonas TaxID=13687 RepID=UPI000DEEFEE9|nr:MULTISPECIES: SGNH/GDSL hydrolase family protein [Sphingomonas]